MSWLRHSAVNQDVLILNLTSAVSLVGCLLVLRQAVLQPPSTAGWHYCRDNKCWPTFQGWKDANKPMYVFCTLNIWQHHMNSKYYYDARFVGSGTFVFIHPSDFSHLQSLKWYRPGMILPRLLRSDFIRLRRDLNLDSPWLVPMSFTWSCLALKSCIWTLVQIGNAHQICLTVFLLAMSPCSILTKFGLVNYNQCTVVFKNFPLSFLFRTLDVLVSLNEGQSFISSSLTITATECVST